MKYLKKLLGVIGVWLELNTSNVDPNPNVAVNYECDLTKNTIPVPFTSKLHIWDKDDVERLQKIGFDIHNRDRMKRIHSKMVESSKKKRNEKNNKG